MSPRRIAALCGLALALTVAAGTIAPRDSRAQAGPVAASLERSVKAAFLFKFLAYTEFPATAFADAAAPVVIGVVGADDMAAELGRIVAGRTVGIRPIQVRALREQDVPAGIHLLFVAGSDSGRLARVLKAGQQSPMLVVSEAESGLQAGSIINFKIIDDRVRFDVSLEAADRNNVKLSSRLLTVAHQVYKGGS